MAGSDFYLYIIGPDVGHQKIGFSSDVNSRLRSLQTGNPLPLKIHHMEPIAKDRIRLMERQLHHELKHQRLKGEWFDITPEDAKLMLKYAMIRWLDDSTLKYR